MNNNQKEAVLWGFGSIVIAALPLVCSLIYEYLSGDFTMENIVSYNIDYMLLSITFTSSTALLIVQKIISNKKRIFPLWYRWISLFFCFIAYSLSWGFYCRSHGNIENCRTTKIAITFLIIVGLEVASGVFAAIRIFKTK